MTRMPPLIAMFGAALLFLVAGQFASAYCAVCQTALLNSPEGQKLAVGFAGGIGFLLAAPFVVVGAMVLLIFKRELSASFRRVAGRVAPILFPRLPAALNSSAETDKLSFKQTETAGGRNTGQAEGRQCGRCSPAFIFLTQKGEEITR